MINEDQRPQSARAINGPHLNSPEVVYLGLGTNLGDRESNLRQARERVKAIGLRVTRASSIYETEPVGYKDQPWFLNQVFEAAFEPGEIFNARAETAALMKLASERDKLSAFMLQAEELLRALLAIETEMGRNRTMPDGPRVIDIDLLIFDGVEGFVTATTSDPGLPGAGHAGLTVPHPRMHLRRFVLEPLCEIAPDLVHPGSGKTCRELLAALDDPSIVRLYSR